MSRSRVSVLSRRVLNGMHKWRSGLTLWGESITPDVPNDLYQAHASIYTFFSSFCSDRRALDLGSGAGYGTALLARAAREVVAVDLDARNIRYSRRRYALPHVTFLRADATALPSDIGTFDVIASSNMFEHLPDVPRALDGVPSRLRSDGVFLLAVPPIVDEASMRANTAIRYHRSNLYVHEWLALLSTRFAEIATYMHQPPPGSVLDFGDPYPSSMTPDRFVFRAVPVQAYPSEPTLTALFACRSPCR